MDLNTGVDLRSIRAGKIKSGLKGAYKRPSKLRYKMMYRRFLDKGNTRLARLAYQAAGLVNQL